MALSQPIIISNFQTGMSSSSHTTDGAFALAQGLDITRDLGTIRLSNILEKKSGTTITGKPKWIVRNPDDGDLFLIDTDHKVYTSTNNGNTWALISPGPTSAGTGNGLVLWKDHLLVIGNSKIDSFGPLSGAPVFLNSFQNLKNSAPIFGPALVGQDDIVYIGNKNVVASLLEVSGKDFDDGDGTTFTFNNDALDLPEEYRIRALEEFGRNLLIGTFKGGTSADDTTNSFNEATIFPWDRTSDTFKLPVTLPEQGIRAMKNINGTVYVVAGAHGSVYTYNETFLNPFAQLPSTIMDRTGGTTIDVIPQGMTFFQGFPRIFYGSGTTPETVNGVYTLIGNKFNFQYIISSNNIRIGDLWIQL